jgi:hypothetical protein
MKIFKIKPEDEGKVFIVRPLPNAKEFPKNMILNYKTYFNDLRKEWEYRYLCFALINDEFKIFDFSKEIHKYFVEQMTLPNTEKPNPLASYILHNVATMLMLNNDRALKITVKTKGGFLNNEYEVIQDDKYRFDNTDEKRKYITGLFSETDLDLSEALKTKTNEIQEMHIQDQQMFPKKINELFK